MRRLLCSQELISINVVKGIKDTVGAKTFLGRAAIPVRPFADRPGETVQDWYDLGKGEWSNEDGTVRAALPPSLTFVQMQDKSGVVIHGLRDCFLQGNLLTTQASQIRYGEPLFSRHSHSGSRTTGLLLAPLVVVYWDKRDKRHEGRPC